LNLEPETLNPCAVSGGAGRRMLTGTRKTETYLVNPNGKVKIKLEGASRKNARPFQFDQGGFAAKHGQKNSYQFPLVYAVIRQHRIQRCMSAKISSSVFHAFHFFLFMETARRKK
jgi:hypothetical protein